MMFIARHGLKFKLYTYFKRHLFCSTIKHANKSYRRKYLSRMSLYLPKTLKEEGLKCTSQDLFLYNEVLFPSHTGAYCYLPLGLRALEKLIRLIDEEMQAIGAQKIAMPSMVRSSLWKKTGRWDTPELFKLKDRHSKEYCLGPTHEELVTDMVSQYGNIPHRRLPIMLYQITKKFRDEMHPKYALLRGREFEMKDLYTFDTDEDTAKETYSMVCDSYCTIFDRLKLDYVKVEGSTGNIGGKLSHEFHLPATIGEDSLYLCNKCGYGSNEELIDAEDLLKNHVTCPKCKAEMTHAPGIEVGHAFLLGTKYSKVFKTNYIDALQKKRLTEMGCYGLGVSRILQASVEVLCQDRKIRWPSLIAPYQVCIIPQMEGYGSEEFNRLSDELSDVLTSLPNLRNEVVIEDRIKSTVGKRIHQADAQGYPHVIVVGRKCLEEPRLYEVIDMVAGHKEFMTQEQIVDKFRHIETI
ncbi:probable proline--tRNA ligase, mitochondrial [Mercenaria mercenaria]|uniref:probable proline--tRNA ligase, mitochondrial n=1 Tax=Mercenaria mercenaria TaxID=6596 RepID=UPI00234F7FD8|nr:probable proline--tRNA ligase, mitochondrial [Mercenaria mercenaria]